jgi:hypothetical protein
MAKSGWLSIRNVPVDPKSRSYFSLLSMALQGKKVCPQCNGTGFSSSATPKVRPDAVVRLKGIKQLEILKSNPKIQMGDVVRELLLSVLSKRVACRTCAGSRFVESKLA